MKDNVICWIAALLIILSSGCSGRPDEPADIQQSEPAASETAAAASSFSERALSVQELASMQELFSSDHSLYSQALTSYYTCPEEVSIKQFFYNGCQAGAAGKLQPTDQEMEFLYELYGEDHPRFTMDITTVSRQEMDADLMSIFGISLEQTYQKELDAFAYCPETDRYFLFHGDTNAMCANLRSGRWIEDQVAELCYEGGFREDCFVVLDVSGEVPHIRSNRTTEEMWLE